jgi:hypothetical protein
MVDVYHVGTADASANYMQTPTLYIVEFKPNARERIPYAPTGAELTCDRDTAEARHRDLVRKGRDGETVEGLLPWCVFVRPEEGGAICLTEYTFAAHPDDPAPEPFGPWASPN